MSYHDKRNPGRVVVAGASEESVYGSDRDEPEVAPNATANQELLAEFDGSRDKVEVWIALLDLLDRLRQRVGYALEDYESQLQFDEELVAELTAEVEAFSRYAAYRYRRRS
jgi:hypothetical protein